jgi:hypothetical protein
LDIIKILEYSKLDAVECKGNHFAEVVAKMQLKN